MCSPPHSVNNGRQQSHDCHAGEYEQDLQQRLPGKHGKNEIYMGDSSQQQRSAGNLKYGP